MSDILSELEEREKEVAEMRRQNADWNYINTLPPRVKAAVILFIEKGDLRLSQKPSGLDLEDFIETLRKARVRIT
ncbi:hypothetical protein [Thermofilum sp.]|uniref:hypothetical protein n=2 Tax=Thermofilum sp. TaxID=1961369 RepID=UPI003164B746